MIGGKGDQQIQPSPTHHAHKTEIQMSCKGTRMAGLCTYESYVLSFWTFCLDHVAPADSPVGSLHTPWSYVLVCSLFLLTLAFLHSALMIFFSSHGGSWLFDGLSYWELQAILTPSNLIFATQFRVCKHPVPHRQANICEPVPNATDMN